MAVYFISGVNKGIGFALLDQLSQDKSNKVIGTIRDQKKAQSIVDLNRSNVSLIELDVSSNLDSCKKALTKVDEIAPEGIDVVIHNAGVLGASPYVPVSDYNAEDYLHPFEVNVVGSVKLYQAISPYLYKGDGEKKFVFLSSQAGQITDSAFNFHGYGASKAALNYFMRQVYVENKQSTVPAQKNSIVFSIHPGLVATDIGNTAYELGETLVNEFGMISATESAQKILETLPKAESGTFVNNDGTVLTF